MRPDLPERTKGFEKDIVGVLGLNRVQFETRRFLVRSLPSGRPSKVGTTGF
jgi:hypothetical protein